MKITITADGYSPVAVDLVAVVAPSGPVAPALPIPAPGHTVIENPPFSATGEATEFGYNDPGDNGIGFFLDPATGHPYATNNQTIIGVSLPREVLLSTFLGVDDWRHDGIDAPWAHYATSLLGYALAHRPMVTIDSGGHTIADVPIVDAGPTASTHNLIDLTWKAARLLNTGGKALATFMVLVNGVAVELKGIDFPNHKVLGS